MSDSNQAGDQLKKLSVKISSSSEILIVTGGDASYDSLACCCGLGLVFENVGKKVLIGSDSEIRVSESDIFGIDKVKKEVGGNNLVISFDYVEGAVDKVSYNIEENKFNLVIAPKKGNTPLDPSKVKFSQVGSKADIIFVVGVKELGELGKIYEENKEVFGGAMVVNIDTKDENRDFGEVNLVNPKASSLCEIGAAMMRVLKLDTGEDGATNLIKGIDKETDNLAKPGLSAEVFEAMAYLLRNGATRGGEKVEMGEVKEKREDLTVSSVAAIRSEEEKVVKENGRDKVKVEEPKKTESPSDDWLTPKVYRGGKLL